MGFLSFRSWIFHGFLGGRSGASHSIVSVCLDTVSVISVVVFSTLESRLAELHTLTCHMDCCCVGWVDPSLEAPLTCHVDCCHVGWVDPFTGSSVAAGWQVAPLSGWISSPGYCLCRITSWWNLPLGKLSCTPELVQ